MRAIAGCLLLCALVARVAPEEYFPPWADMVKEAASRVRFELYTRANLYDAEVVTASQLPTTLQYFNASRPTTILVHGWRSGVSKDIIMIKNGLLSRSDANVVAVNWQAVDSPNFYPCAVRRVPAVARQLGTLLSFLADARRGPGAALSSVHVVGHSLGAHIAGLAALHVYRGRVGRITGLDPAAPLISEGREQRLHRSHATFVDVIHTCGLVLGITDVVGHADFYPNGGIASQPGCALEDGIFGACSHNRAWELFRESVMTNKTLLARRAVQPKAASPCDKVDTQGELVPMGLATPSSAHGVYCLSTRGVEPYGYGGVVAAQLQQAAGRVDEAKKATMLRAFFRTA